MSAKGQAGESRRRWTVLEILRWAEQDFARLELSTPRLDAEILLAEVLGLDRVGLYTGFDRPLVADELDRFRACIERRRRFEPVAYILGEKEFWSLAFEVAPAVLVPRPETELLVERAVKLAPATVLDLGTGSGAIAVALASELPEARVWATDVDAEALAVARRNVERHALSERIHFAGGSLYTPVAGQRFDCIACNPPYIPQAAEVGPGVREHEPALALFAGADGLDVIRPLVAGAAEHLTDGGALLVEVGVETHEAAAQLARDAGLTDVVVHPDLAGIPRALEAHRP